MSTALRYANAHPLDALTQLPQVRSYRYGSSGGDVERVNAVVDANPNAKTRVVSSEISLGKFLEIYSNLSGNFRKFVKYFFTL